MDTLPPYRLVWCNRIGLHSWEFSIAAPAPSSLSSRWPFTLAKHDQPLYIATPDAARVIADDLNRTLKIRGLPGKCFAVLARDLTQCEIAQLMTAA